MCGSAEVPMCVILLSLTAPISNGTWQLECALHGGEGMEIQKQKSGRIRRR